MKNDWDIIDPDNEWGFSVPDPDVGYRRYNQDLRREQGLADNECPYYGELVQTREIHRKGQVMTVFIYSTGWIETWYWKHCPPYRYRAGYWVEGEWFPPDWDNVLENDEWWDSQQPPYPVEDEISWDD